MGGWALMWVIGARGEGDGEGGAGVVVWVMEGRVEACGGVMASNTTLSVCVCGGGGGG